MTEEQYNHSIETSNLQLGWLNKVFYFGIVFFCFIIPTVFLLIIPFSAIKDALWIFIPFILGFVFFYVLKNQLKFRTINTSLTKKDSTQLIEEVCKKFDWSITSMEEKSLLIKTNRSSFSWGEQITVLFDEDRILINSIGSTDRGNSIGAMFNNAGNVKNLTEAIEKS